MFPLIHGECCVTLGTLRSFGFICRWCCCCFFFCWRRLYFNDFFETSSSFLSYVASRCSFFFCCNGSYSLCDSLYLPHRKNNFSSSLVISLLSTLVYAIQFQLEMRVKFTVVCRKFNWKFSSQLDARIMSTEIISTFSDGSTIDSHFFNYSYD